MPPTGADPHPSVGYRQAYVPARFGLDRQQVLAHHGRARQTPSSAQLVERRTSAGGDDPGTWIAASAVNGSSGRFGRTAGQAEGRDCPDWRRAGYRPCRRGGLWPCLPSSVPGGGIDFHAGVKQQRVHARCKPLTFPRSLSRVVVLKQGARFSDSSRGQPPALPSGDVGRGKTGQRASRRRPMSRWGRRLPGRSPPPRCGG